MIITIKRTAGRISLKSKPFFSSENIKRNQRRQYHKSNGKRVSVSPVFFGKNREVHAIHAGNKRWWHKDHRNNRKNFYGFILFNIQQTKEGVLQILQTLETERGVIQK